MGGALRDDTKNGCVADKTQKSVDIGKEFMLRTAKPCAPRTRKPQLYEQLFRSCMAFTKSFASLVGRVVKYATDKRRERLRRH